MLCGFLRQKSLFLLLLIMSALVGGCSVEASRLHTNTASTPTASAKFSTITIAPNSPADTVRAFYKNLREGKIREAILLTNLRPAIEGLTDAELKEFQVDFEAIGKHVPPEIKINGEIISGNNATVTAKLPDLDSEKDEFQQISLRKEGDVWVILTVDDSAEKRIKLEGKNYFHNLRLETHEDEARDMLDRVAKAQIAYAAQNKGLYGDMQALIAAGLLPEDIRSSVTTGYNFTLTVTADKTRYSAAASPAVYGKTGKRSFKVELNQLGQPRLVSLEAKRRKAK